MKRIVYIILFSIFVIGITACSRHESEVAAAPYNYEALYNFQMGKNYLAEGRYELAKERFTLALAANRNPEMQDTLVHELEAVNMMIQTLR